MAVAHREKRTARVHFVTLPSKKERWEELAAAKGEDLTRLIERAMEREVRSAERRRRWYAA